MATEDRKPLISYLKLEKEFERDLLFTLDRAAKKAERDVARLVGRSNVGSVIRASQMSMVARALRFRVAELWIDVGSEVRAGQVRAGAEAMTVMVEEYEAVLLRSGLSADNISTFTKAAVAQAEQGAIAAATRMSLTQVPLSTRVYESAMLQSGRIDRIVNEALARGLSARELASEVRGFINPKTPGGARYAAMRLARTEINNAFHGIQVQESIDSPFIERVEWHLSGSHKVPDACNRYAEDVHEPGEEPGIWRPTHVPRKPHPQCLCFTTPVVIDEEEFFQGMAAGRFDAHLESRGVNPHDQPVPRA